MLYDVEKIAELTGVSKVTIYRKMKLQEVSCYITIKNGKQYLNEDGFNLIKGMFAMPEDKDEPKEAQGNNDAVPDDVMSINKELLEMLKLQLAEKDRQITEKDKQIDTLSRLVEHSHKLIENSQVLLKDKNDKQPDDETAITIVEDPKKGFFKRIFGK